MESITGGNTPKYQELTEQLRLQIVSGEIAPGQKLPSENYAFRTVSGQPSDGAQGIGDFAE